MSLYIGLLYGIHINYGIVDYILEFILACVLPITSMPYIYQPYRGLHMYRSERFSQHIIWCLYLSSLQGVT